MAQDHEEGPPAAPRRAARFWLFAPYVMLALLAVAWSGAWFVVRGQTLDGLDAWLERERAQGRRWACPDRSVGGFPFRIEVRCPSLAVEGRGLAASFGPVSGLAQVYNPRHVIVEAAGPLRLQFGALQVEGPWRLLQASVRTAKEGLERLSLILDRPSLRLAGLAAEPIALAARKIEAHGRPALDGTAARPAYDASLRAEGATLPPGTIPGSDAPANVEVVAKVSGLPDLDRGGGPETMEAWRAAGGRVDLGRFSLATGPMRIEGTGGLTLDEQHRLAGRIEWSGAGVEPLLQALAGRAGALVGAALGSLAPKTPAGSSAARPRAPDLKPLPSLRFEGGRVYAGPLQLPGVRLLPLY